VPVGIQTNAPPFALTVALISFKASNRIVGSPIAAENYLLIATGISDLRCTSFAFVPV